MYGQYRNLKKRMADLSIGESFCLPLEHYQSARSTASRLKRDWGAVFSVSRLKSAVVVTRIGTNEGEIDEIMLRRNGFRLKRGKMIYEEEGVRLSYGLNSHRLVFECDKGRGTIEVEQKSDMQSLLELLNLKLYLK